jgi:hypothetical protein
MALLSVRRTLIRPALYRAPFVVATIFLCTGGLSARGLPQSRATGLPQEQRKPPNACEMFVIQGRITAMEGYQVTVKAPDAFPGGVGIHPQFVIEGPDLKVDVSHARMLLPDGWQPDRRPLAVGDRVLMVLIRPHKRPPGPGGPCLLISFITPPPLNVSSKATRSSLTRFPAFTTIRDQRHCRIAGAL